MQIEWRRLELGQSPLMMLAHLEWELHQFFKVFELE